MALALSRVTGLAQGVTVEVQFDQQYFLPHETLVAKVRVTNYSGQTLNLGQDADWLSFTIESRKDRMISRLAPVPVAGEYTLESSRTGTKAVDLAPYFDLSRPGHYTVTASMRIPQWDRVIQSAPKGFDVIAGTKLWEQEFGLPQIEGAASEHPEIRKYALVQTMHQKQILLYIRVSDAAETRVFRIFQIGPMVSLSNPEPQLDKFSNLHLLYQITARRFRYSAVSPDGLVIARETYEYADAKPKLRSDSDGRIKVFGGARRFTDEDVPASFTSTSASDGESPKP